METWDKRIFLNKILPMVCVLAMAVFATQVQAAEEKTTREITLDKLDDENFSIGVQAGFLSIEDFGSDTWYQANLSYHLNEFFYFKANYAQAEAGLTSFEKLANVSQLLDDEQRKLKYYGLNVGYNLMPGEVFITPELAFNSAFSFELGGGNVQFAGQDQFALAIASQFRVFLTDWLAWDISMQNLIFDTQITGVNKTTHNLSFNTGFSIYF